MAMYDLTTLAACKLWLGSSNDNSDTLISQQITEISSMVMGWLNGPTFLKKTRTEFYDGKGRVALALKNFPVLSITSVQSAGRNIPVSSSWPLQAGYFLEPWDGDVPSNLQSVLLNGYWFSKGYGSVQIVYTTGYVATDEAVSMNTSYQYTPLSPQGLMVADADVTYAATGVALAAVRTSPSVGQYIPRTH